MTTKKKRSETTISVPKELKTKFEKLPKNWLNFANFCREAIREKLTQEERLQTWVAEDTEGRPPYTPQDSQDKDKPL